MVSSISIARAQISKMLKASVLTGKGFTFPFLKSSHFNLRLVVFCPLDTDELGAEASKRLEQKIRPRGKVSEN